MRLVSMMQLTIVLLAVALAGGCAQTQKQDLEKTSYDHNSWKSLIPDSCMTFNDGCNNCRRSSTSDLAACTRKACARYKKPVCLDK